jgi:hypothetical protein
MSWAQTQGRALIQEGNQAGEAEISPGKLREVPWKRAASVADPLCDPGWSHCSLGLSSSISTPKELDKSATLQYSLSTYCMQGYGSEEHRPSLCALELMYGRGQRTKVQ